ncbi:MAG: hypothetical protein AAFV45_07185 [Pseudomonadota bacterium]
MHKTKEPPALMVQYKLVDGTHFFIGAEECEETQGLCVGSRNLKEAFEQVTPALEFLLEANHGIDIRCRPEITYAQFLRQLIACFEEDLAHKVTDDFSSSFVDLPDSVGCTKLWMTKNLGGNQVAN